ncbi:MAG TPA: disulfide oxidoreductase [Acidimicrobiia bacterium]|nr:disulfide oxidoreductase [Acidimicrobiia bacterium]
MDTETFTTFFVWLALACNVATAALVVALVAAPRVSAARSFVATMGESALPLAAAVALVATAGSLYYSEVAHFVPCRYCWFQRIFMYPLAVVLPVAAVRRDPSIRWYALPLAAIGAGFSVYHYLLQRYPDLAGASSCDLAAPCTAAYVWKYDFVSIPYMAGSGFVFIGLLLLATITNARITRERSTTEVPA